MKVDDIYYAIFITTPNFQGWYWRRSHLSNDDVTIILDDQGISGELIYSCLSKKKEYMEQIIVDIFEKNYQFLIPMSFSVPELLKNGIQPYLDKHKDYVVSELRTLVTCEIHEVKITANPI